MEGSGLTKSAIHYHVRWSSDPYLDWKSLSTREEAVKLAMRIKKPNESYIVVERDDKCERCKEFKWKASLALMPKIRDQQV